MIDEIGKTVTDSWREILRLREENAALNADARRYRWMRAQALSSKSLGLEAFVSLAQLDHRRNAEDFDDAIDTAAAMGDVRNA